MKNNLVSVLHHELAEGGAVRELRQAAIKVVYRRVLTI